METTDVYSYITSQKNAWRTERVPLTNSKDWNMYEHIQRCKNVANGWYHRGKNDGLRPYDDIVTPVINVAFRSEGFDVRDIVPFVNSADDYYKSFLVKKYHPQWARKNELDTFIDEVVESSVIYDLVLVKDINNVRPEVVDLTTLAFCDQTDVMAGPIAIKHDMTIAELTKFKGKWDADKIDQAITLGLQKKTVNIADDQDVNTPGKYVEIYELRGNLPERWVKEDGEIHKYTDQMHIVCYYQDNEGKLNGITLYKGEDKPLNETFKALKIDQVRSKGRACGKSIVETLFEPQVWNNYSAIKIKDLLDSAINIFQTDSDEYGNRKLSDIKTNTVVKHEPGRPITRVDGSLQNLQHFQNHQTKQENSARILGSASEASLGTNPTSGTPFALQDLIVQEGNGMHEYRQGKIATFFADVLYRDLILDYLVKEMNAGKRFSEDLTFDELDEIAEVIVNNEVNREIKELILKGEIITEEGRALLIETKKKAFLKGGTRRFFETMKGDLKDIPMDVYVNIKGKQRRMAENADKLTKVIREIIANPQAFAQIPGLGKAFNELLEESGMSPINFSQITLLQEPKPEEALAMSPALQAVV